MGASVCLHIPLVQTHPGILRQNFLFLLAFLVLHASHASGVELEDGLSEGDTEWLGFSVGLLLGVEDGEDVDSITSTDIISKLSLAIVSAASTKVSVEKVVVSSKMEASASIKTLIVFC